MLLTDIETPNDSGLLICDYDKKRIRLYQGTDPAWDQRLMEEPAAISAFRPLASEPPLFAVGAGPWLYIYKSLKPHLKFSLPDCVCALKELFTTDEHKTSRLIVGLENGSILILDLHATVINKCFAINSPPVSLEVAGIFADYNIFAVARNKAVFRLGTTDGLVTPAMFGDPKQKPIEPWYVLPRVPVTSCRTSLELVVACMGGCLVFLAVNRNDPAREVAFKEPIVTVASFQGHKNAVVVGLCSGEIVLVVNHVKMQSIHIDVKLSAICVGRFAREENALIAVTQCGAILTKILVRGALDKTLVLEEKRALKVPIKSPLYFELIERERINFKAMATKYARDMSNLKALAFEELITLHRDKKAAVKESPTVKIIGLGPEYRMIVSLKPTNKSASVYLTIGNVDENAYKFVNNSQTFRGDVEIKAVFNFELTDYELFSGKSVKLTIQRDGQISLQTLVHIPPSEVPLILD